MKYTHSNLAAGRWHSLSIAEQLGNVGSEVERAIRWYEKNNREYFESAFLRMLELLDLTIGDKRWTGRRRRELTRVREMICDSFENGNKSSIQLSQWPKYFMPFAILARASVI
ncbi:MAG: hypothetical protein AAB592_01085 [Patescibacteria group bacterium]